MINPGGGVTVSNSVQRRNAALLLCAVGLLAVLSWKYTIEMATHAHGPTATSVTAVDHHSWGFRQFAIAGAMWIVMMAAMMLPSVAPWITAFAGINKTASTTSLLGSAGGFLTGYLAVWSGFSLLASGAQWFLHEIALLSSSLVTNSPMLGGGLLIAAGVYQWTPAKYACLSHCRSPLSFLMTSWQDGRSGAFQMGWRHGLFCVGCCWALMSLSFVAGIMNLVWMAGITIFIFIDHNLPLGKWFGTVTGLVLLGWGVWWLP